MNNYTSSLHEFLLLLVKHLSREMHILVLWKECLDFTAGVEQGNGKMPVTEIIALLGTLASAEALNPELLQLNKLC